MRYRYHAERLKSPTYTPNRLINKVAEMLELERDSHLANALGVYPSDLCRMRRRQRYIDAEMILRIHDVTGLTIAEIRELMGDECDTSS
jgi:plasmid maintenance system antidote protein VapI